MIDLTVGHPSGPSHSSAPLTSRHLANQREKDKTTRYLDTLTSSSLLLTPFAMETFGAFGDRAMEFIKLLSKVATDSLSPSLSPPPIAASLSILLQKMNAFILSRGVVLLRSSTSPSSSSPLGLF